MKESLNLGKSKPLNLVVTEKKKKKSASLNRGFRKTSRNFFEETCFLECKQGTVAAKAKRIFPEHFRNTKSAFVTNIACVRKKKTKFSRFAEVL